MNQPSYLLLRGASWHFRRRLPGTQGKVIQIPLGTASRETAIRIAARMSLEFDLKIDWYLKSGSVIPDELVAKYFDFCLRRMLTDIPRDRRRVLMSGRATVEARRAEELRPSITANMLEDGLYEDMPIDRISEYTTLYDLDIALKVHRQQYREVMRSLAFGRYKGAAKEILGVEKLNIHHENQLREVYLQASAAVLHEVARAPAAVSEAARSRVAEMMSEKISGTIPSRSAPALITALAPTPAHQATSTNIHEAPKPEPAFAAQTLILTEGLTLIEGHLTHEKLDAQFLAARASKEEIDRSPRTHPFSHDIAGVTERSIRRDLAAKKIDERTADSRRSTTKMFMFCTGLQLVTDIEQHHIAIFLKNIKMMPTHFLRSIKDKPLTLRDALARGDTLDDERIGREAGTLNRYLDTIGALMSYARSQDKIPVERDFDTSKQRIPELKRARDKRIAFGRDDVVKLFRHTIWHGCLRQDRRHIEGDQIIKDGLYFVPLIVGYTGSRFEEIAGLRVDSIVNEGEEFGLDIAPNELRRVKNLQSARLLPIHRHLIDLGLIEHRDALIKSGEEYLFPELIPNNPKYKFQKRMKYNWDKARRLQLGEAAEDKTMHSLRHYVNIVLKDNKDVEKAVRLDILGHAAGDLNEEVYTAGASFAEKLDAINSIPRVF